MPNPFVPAETLSFSSWGAVSNAPLSHIAFTGSGVSGVEKLCRMRVAQSALRRREHARRLVPRAARPAASVAPRCSAAAPPCVGSQSHDRASGPRAETAAAATATETGGAEARAASQDRRKCTQRRNARAPPGCVQRGSWWWSDDQQRRALSTLKWTGPSCPLTCAVNSSGALRDGRRRSQKVALSSIVDAPLTRALQWPLRSMRACCSN